MGAGVCLGYGFPELLPSFGVNVCYAGLEERREKVVGGLLVLSACVHVVVGLTIVTFFVISASPFRPRRGCPPQLSLA